jgi:N-acetylneuraminic acid mutarotase
VYAYDPIQDKWREGTSMPTPRAYAGAAHAGGKIYVIGGWDGQNDLSVNESYSPYRDIAGENAWEEDVSLPEGVSGMGMQSIGDMIFVFGAGVTLQYLPQDEIWSVITGETPFAELNKSGATNLQGYFYIFGGADDQGITDASYRYQAFYQTFMPVVQNEK